VCDYDDCTKRFRVERDLEIHLRKHRGERPYVCSECDKAFAERIDYKRHMKLLHSGESNVLYTYTLVSWLLHACLRRLVDAAEFS
jgi:uncharacterized C2H2 Zn-finger protein